MIDSSLRTIMTSTPITVGKEDCLDKVADLFEQHNVHHLPVIDEQSQLIGIISKTDFDQMTHGLTLFKIPDREAYNKTLFRMTRVVEVMTKDIVELSPSDSIATAYRIFKKNKFRAIPIIENGQLVGIVTPLDLLDFFMKQD